MANPEASKYVSGIAVHWYEDFLASPSVLTKTHELLPELFILATEACEGFTITCSLSQSKFKSSTMILPIAIMAR